MNAMELLIEVRKQVQSYQWDSGECFQEATVIANNIIHLVSASGAKREEPASGRCPQCAVADQLQCVLDAGHEDECAFAEWPYRAAREEPAVAAARRDETGWLIERDGLCLGFCEHRFAWVAFTNEQALRFARSADAYSFKETVKWTPFNLPLEDAIVTEHRWG